MKCPSAVAVFAISAAGLALAACADEPERTAGRYCTEVGNRLDELNAPALSTGEDVDAMLDAWRTVARAAPLAIEPEWDALVDTMETAATVDPADPASVQKVADTARRNEPAANRVIEYTFSVCGATIGAVTPTPASTVPAASTTVAVTSTTSG